MSCCLVDYDCPEKVGFWAESTFASEVQAGRLVIERVAVRPSWNRGASQNIGAHRAIREGARHLVLIDGDTVVQDGFANWLVPRLNDAMFWIASLREDGTDERDVYGLVVAPAAAYSAINGYYEGFVGWGAEDVDLRLRLFFEARLTVGEMPLELIRTLPHDDELRTRFHAEKNIRVSDMQNHRTMYARLLADLGLTPEDILASAPRLLCHLRPRQ